MKRWTLEGAGLMQITVRKVDDTVILDLKGNFDVNASDFIEIVGNILRQGIKKLVCNLENVNMMDYMGLSALAIAYKNIGNHEANIRFYNVPVHIKNIFSLLLLDSVFEIYPNEAEALASLRHEDVFAAISKKKLRRRFKRLPIELNVKFKPKFGSNQTFLDGKIFNLSAIGIFIYTKNIFNLNDMLRIQLPLGTKQKIIELDARVVWLADKILQPQASPGMGVEFYKIGPKLEKKIIQFVDRNLPRQTPLYT